MAKVGAPPGDSAVARVAQLLSERRDLLRERDELQKALAREQRRATELQKSVDTHREALRRAYAFGVGRGRPSDEGRR